MFRWSYLVPRLLVVLGICLWVRFGLDAFVRHAIIAGGQAATGAKVELGALQTSLLHGRLYLADAQVANPRAPMKNLVQFKGAWLDMDLRALLERRCVVSQGTLVGLQFDTERGQSGELPASPKSALAEKLERDYAERWKVELGQAAEEWLAGLVSRLQLDLEREFRSPGLAKELGRRWPAEYARLAERVNGWRERAERLRQLAINLRERPLEHLGDLQQGLSDVEALRAEIGELRGEIERLQREALADRDAVREATRQDVGQIREKLHMPTIDGQQLTEYLLGPELKARADSVADWLERGRETLKYIAKRPELNHERGRGVDVAFASAEHDPDFLIQSLAVSGSGSWDRQPFRFLGRVQGLTHQPRRYARPARIQLATSGALDLQIEGTVDYSGETPRQYFVVNCPAIRQPELVLGRSDSLAITVSPGAAKLWAQLYLVGDDLKGEVRWRQDEVALRPVVAGRFGGKRLQDSLAAALGEVHQLQSSIELSGRVTQPSCSVRSNLGPQLVQGLNTAAQRELQRLGEEIAAKADTVVQEQLATLEQTLQTRHGELLAMLTSGEQQVENVKQQLAERVKQTLPSAALENALRKGMLLGR